MLRPSFKKFTVAVEGNISSGKSTFLDFAKLTGDIDIVKEPITWWQNINGYNILDLYYQDPKRWGLAFQSLVQLSRLRSHLSERLEPLRLIERSFYSNRYCFLECLKQNNTLDNVAVSVLEAYHDYMCEKFDISPDIIVYLRTDPAAVLDRMLARSREEERDIKFQLLKSLHEQYENWLIHRRFPVSSKLVVIDATQSLDVLYKEYAKILQNIKYEVHLLDS